MRVDSHFNYEERDDYLTLEYFKNLSKNKIVVLGYNWINQGEFLWRHNRIIRNSWMDENSRIIGDVGYLNNSKEPAWMGEGEYLYEFVGVICRGSGAEPLYLISDNHEAYLKKRRSE